MRYVARGARRAGTMRGRGRGRGGGVGVGVGMLVILEATDMANGVDTA